MSAPQIDATHDIRLRSWLDGADGHRDFPVQNLALGVFSIEGENQRGGVAIGNYVLDLQQLSSSGLVTGCALEAAKAASHSNLNKLFAMGSAPRAALRAQLSHLLSDISFAQKVRPLLFDAQAVKMHLPTQIGDYTDFYVGIHHAMNIGSMFRPESPLLPNYKHVPIGYHGRASSVRPSGTPVLRPSGQRKTANGEFPTFGPTQRLDYELELAVWIGGGNQLGEPIPIAEANEHIAGLSLLNDWSARDFQSWEYQPLGPFMSKNFMTSVSPWVVTSEALAPFRIRQPARPIGDPTPLPYLWNDDDQAWGAFALQLEVSLRTAAMCNAGIEPFVLSCGPAFNMYWTIAQMVTHHASNGCNLSPGDLLGSGTISGPDRDSWGSLMEIAKGGAEPIKLPTAESRTFLEDGDEIIMTARLAADGFASIGFGECRGQITTKGGHS